MAKIEFKHDLGEIKKNLKELPVKVDAIIDAVVDRRAIAGTAAMKTNAPWTDRTGAARSGLHTVVNGADVQTFFGRMFFRDPKGKRRSIIFSHTVHYGIWLEIANSGRYQVIMPTVREQGNILMSELEDLFADLQAGRGR